MKVAINGFGRIGRCVLRAALKKNAFENGFELLAINDPGGAASAAQLLKYDTVHRNLENKIEHGEDWISIDGKKIEVLSERDPAKLPWQERGVQAVLECTGVFRDREGASKHFEGGAKKVLLSAPAKEKGADITVVMGVNDDKYERDKHDIVSLASCTTNSLAPVVKLVNDNFGLENGFMTTCHAYTASQNLLDGAHKDPRRARAAAVNVVPTSTGAAAAIGEVIPEVDGKLDGIALRVPVPCGSITDMTFNVKQKVEVEELNKVFEDAQNGPMKGILQYSQDPLVSSDILGNPHSAILDAPLTKAIGRAVKLFSWYDNEWGYSNRMVDMAERL